MAKKNLLASHYFFLSKANLSASPLTLDKKSSYTLYVDDDNNSNKLTFNNNGDSSFDLVFTISGTPNNLLISLKDNIITVNCKDIKTLTQENFNKGLDALPNLKEKLTITVQDLTALWANFDGAAQNHNFHANQEAHNIKRKELSNGRIILPPSGAIAGIYARVDNERGVWKAPANVSLNGVIAPITKITDEQQAELNVHSSGKSINVIRSFVGMGNLVWGSRTLAGADNEWRYIPVRRLFNMIEESLQKSTRFAVFEPNSELTWLKVKVMINNYLYELWNKGALAGAKPEQAYFVDIGKNTMTQQDILEGRMILNVGIAAARPAEFIILRFSHLLQSM